jgi:hypothetical protein
LKQRPSNTAEQYEAHLYLPPDGIFRGETNR